MDTPTVREHMAATESDYRIRTGMATTPLSTAATVNLEVDRNLRTRTMAAPTATSGEVRAQAALHELL